jgi:hypothetical protein
MLIGNRHRHRLSDWVLLLLLQTPSTPAAALLQGTRTQEERKKD